MIYTLANVFKKYTEIGFYKNLSANVLILVLNTLTGLVAARALQPQGRGIQAAIVMWPQFFAYTFTFGVSTAIIYRLNTDRTGHQVAVGTSLMLSILYGILAASIGFLCLPFILKNYSSEAIFYAQLMMIFVPLVLINTTLTDIMQAKQDYNMLSVSRFVGPLISLFLLYTMYLLNFINPYRASLAILLPNVLLLMGNIIWLRIAIPGRLSVSLVECRRITALGIKFYGSHLIGTVSDQVDRIIVIGFLSTVDLGYYGIALSLSRVLNAVQTATTMSILPKIINKSDESIKSTLKRAFILTLSLSLFVGLVMVATSRFLISTFFGPSYLNAVSSYDILVAEAILLGCTNVIAQFFMAKGRPQINTYIISIAFIIGVPFMFWFSRIYGLIGVSFGLLLITSIRLLSTGILFIWFTKFQLKNNTRKLLIQIDRFENEKSRYLEAKSDE